MLILTVVGDLGDATRQARCQYKKENQVHKGLLELHEPILLTLAGVGLQAMWVRLNKCTETAIGYNDSENSRFLCSSSSKKGIDIKTIFLAEKLGCRCFH
jgi:hypothetical protein